MSHEEMIRAAELWGRADVVGKAKEWLRSGPVSALLELPASQVAFLCRSSGEARTPEEFVEGVRKFLEKRASREKRRGVWHRLLESLPAAVDDAAKSAVCTDDSRNKAFQACSRLLARSAFEEGAKAIEQERKLAAMRAFVDALARQYRSWKVCGGDG